MPKQRKIPVRTCVGCGAKHDKRYFVRIVRTKDGEVFVDTTMRANGRGASICPKVECFEKAASGRLGQTLRVRLTEDDVDRLRRDFESATADKVAS
ncbi:MAG: YlxR family protein [Coriobacteriia bacterium]